MEYTKPINLHASTLVIKCISKLMDMLGIMMAKCLDQTSYNVENLGNPYFQADDQGTPNTTVQREPLSKRLVQKIYV